MKKVTKKLLSLLLTFGMIISMFSMTSATVWAANANVPKSMTLVAYKKPVTEFLTLLPAKATSLKSSNTSVVSVKQSKFNFGTQPSYSVSLTPKKAGTATVSLKYKGKTYKTKVTVKKYVNPVKSVSLGNTVISGSKFKSASEISLSYAKFAGKNLKTKVQLAKGWQLEKLFIYNGNPANGSIKPAIEYLQKGWARTESVANGSKIPVAGGKGFKIMFTATNTKTGVSEPITITLK